MKLTIRSSHERRVPLFCWHRWFAWRPVRVGPHDVRWLEHIERRRWLTPDMPREEWTYRPAAGRA